MLHESIEFMEHIGKQTRNLIRADCITVTVWNTSEVFILQHMAGAKHSVTIAYSVAFRIMILASVEFINSTTSR